MWLLCLPQLRYWRGGGEGRPIAIRRCLSPSYSCTILAAFESNYIMSRIVEIWELLVKMSKFGIKTFILFFSKTEENL